MTDLPAADRDVLAAGWHWLGHRAEFDHRYTPHDLLPGALDEPCLVTVDDGDVRVLSNVCTHRSAIVLAEPTDAACISCPYHGRRFRVDGALDAAPGFDGVEGFPTPADDLAVVPHVDWRGLLFAALDPRVAWDDVVRPIEERCGTLPWASLALDPTRSADHVVRANWRLYCENYLEGFHIPWVHPELAGALDLDSYRTEAFEHACLQVADARPDEPTVGDGDARVAAWYWFLFPATMLNVYPWGVSVNAVEPLGPELTRVRFRSLVWDASLLAQGAGGALDLVERQDQQVVEAVARGSRSRFAVDGRLHPTRELGVQWFRERLSRS